MKILSVVRMFVSYGLVFFTSFQVTAQQSIKLQTVQSFLYQLQDLDLVSAGATEFDLIIMDYSPDGSDEMRYTADQINTLKHSSGREKIVLSYLSIGEAENYRYYWQSNWKRGNPDWLDKENSDWEGNYKVKYWDESWQAIILDYLDKILAAGFDGVYLDLIDAYEWYLDKGREAAPQEMVDFVAVIADHARSSIPDFLIFPQNAAELGAMIPSYIDLVDGIGQEDLHYGYDKDGDATPTSVTEEMEESLDIFQSAGKLVLTTDYPFSKSEDVPHFDSRTLDKIADAYQRSRAKGYVPYCTVRNLNYLTISPGFEPSGISSDALRTDSFILLRNYPNPFNSSTRIVFRLEDTANVRLSIYSARGQPVLILKEGVFSSGNHETGWNGRDIAGNSVPGGIYVIRLETDNSIRHTKCVLIK